MKNKKVTFKNKQSIKTHTGNPDNGISKFINTKKLGAIGRDLETRKKKSKNPKIEKDQKFY